MVLKSLADFAPNTLTISMLNEQFLDPLTEAEVEEICQSLIDGSLDGFNLYRKAA